MEWMEVQIMRLIDADKLTEQWTIASPEPYSTDAAEVLDSIKDAPTIDAVPVVRCKDCKHGAPGWEGFVFCGHPEYDLLEGMIAHEEDHFCRYGERLVTWESWLNEER